LAPAVGFAEMVRLSQCSNPLAPLHRRTPSPRSRELAHLLADALSFRRF
jgi:hypothetical protein